MSTLTPDRALQQRRDALARANETRSARKRLKADLKAGRVNPADILLDPPEWAEQMRVIDFLLAVPRYGCAKANTVMNRGGVSTTTTIARMSERQRKTVVRLLGVPR